MSATDTAIETASVDAETIQLEVEGMRCASCVALPAGELVGVDFVPERPGEYEFTCGMGMLPGKVVPE